MSHREMLARICQRVRSGGCISALDFAQLEMNLPRQVGDNMRQVRRQLHLTQSDAANGLGVSVSQYRKYERGQDSPKFYRMLPFIMETGAPLTFFYCRTHYIHYFGAQRLQARELPLAIFCARATETEFTVFCYELGFDRAPGDNVSLAATPVAQACEPGLPGSVYRSHLPVGFRSMRETLGLTQEKMAAAMGLAVRTYSQYECLRDPPGICTHYMLRLWASTGVSPDRLYYGLPYYDRVQMQYERLRQVREWLTHCPVKTTNEVLHRARSRISDWHTSFSGQKSLPASWPSHDSAILPAVGR